MIKRVRMMVLGAVAALAVSTIGASVAEAGGRWGPRRGGYSYSHGRSYGYGYGGPRYYAPRAYYGGARYWAPPRRVWNNCGPSYYAAPRSFGFSFGYSRGGWGRPGCGW